MQVENEVALNCFPEKAEPVLVQSMHMVSSK